MDQTRAQKYLLSIDGGGVRGIIPVLALVKLEQATGLLCRQIFSFVAGTSTGAVIASAIAAGVPASRILDFYLKRSLDVFPKRPWNTIKRVFTGSIYSTEKLRNVLADQLGPAKEWSINDSPVDLLITAKRVADGMPWYFVRDNPFNSGCTGSFKPLDCVTASSAAPTYFQPWNSDETIAGNATGRERLGALIDGGVGVTGNPVYRGLRGSLLLH
ncbi:MAG: patatin-like phospholipase family protein [Pyrinomonadaceae bacterium]